MCLRNDNSGEVTRRTKNAYKINEEKKPNLN